MTKLGLKASLFDNPLIEKAKRSAQRLCGFTNVFFPRISRKLG